MPRDNDWFQAEHDALEALRFRGDIGSEEYRQKLRDLRRDAAREDYERDLRDAGRGHLIGGN